MTKRKNSGPPTTYQLLMDMGWKHDGLRARGGGMGYSIWREFTHPEYGVLAFETNVSDQLSESKARKQDKAAYKERVYHDWYLLLRRPDQTDFDWDCEYAIFTGEDVAELPQVISEARKAFEG